MKVFVDKIFIFAKNRQEDFKRLEIVFSKLKDTGLKVAKEKCEFFKNSINYLGHIIDKNGCTKMTKRLKPS